MNENLKGEARLEEDHEHDQFVQFKMASRGRVIVSGQLVQLEGHTNRLSFTFVTDQTCLQPFIGALEKFDK